MRYPDFLDGLGKVPREEGTLHVFLEALQVVDGRRYVASVLLQAAFEPAGHALLFVRPEHGAPVRAAAPALIDGQVVRLRVPLTTPRPVDFVELTVDADPPEPLAQRVRPAWKLSAVHEAPKLFDLEPPNADVVVDERAPFGFGALVGTFLGRGGAAVFEGARGTRTGVGAGRVHAPTPLAPQRVELLEGLARPIEAPEVEELWRPGQPLPPGLR